MKSKKLEGDALAACIEEVEKGSIEAAYALACQTIDHDVDDLRLMRWRRDFLFLGTMKAGRSERSSFFAIFQLTLAT